MVSVVYKVFTVGELFDCFSGRFVSVADRRSVVDGRFRLPIVSSKTSGNGIYGYVEEDKFRVFEDCLTVTKNGEPGICFYHNYPFTVNSDAMVLVFRDVSGMNYHHYLYVATVLSKVARFRFDYNNKLGKNLLGVELLLPVYSLSDTEPAWDYMEEFIRGVECSFVNGLDIFVQDKKKLLRIEEG